MVPDNNHSGWASSIHVSGQSGADQEGSLQVNLNWTGGWNGDRHAYPVASNGTLVVLMSQPGVGVNAIGGRMNITLLDGPSGHGTSQSEVNNAVLGRSDDAAGTLAGFNGSRGWREMDAFLRGPGQSIDLPAGAAQFHFR